MAMETPGDLLFFLGAFAFPVGVGLLSSLTHCAGMCGPIHLFLARESGRALWLYHAGRIAMYTLLGGLAGGLSRSVTFPGMRWVWVALYLVLGLRLIGVPLWPAQWGVRYGGWLMHRLRPLTQRAASGDKNILFVLGFAAGLLPCATTQAGLAWAVASGHPVTGAAGMALLGAGTLPLFLAVPRKWIPTGTWYHDLLGVLMILLAGWKVYTMAFTSSPSCH
jgi:sulfite exporter TauE/SafE